MKTLKTYITEVAVTAPNVMHDANATIEKLKKELSHVLGNRYVIKANVSGNLGKSAHLRIVDTHPANGIDHNSPVFMQFMMYLSTSHGKDADLDKVSWKMSQGPRSVPYRKITSAKSIDDATSKLIQWFKQNKSKLDSLLHPLKEENIRSIDGVFDKENLARIHKLQPFKVDDILISRKGEKFTVVKIQALSNSYAHSLAIDIVGSNKGKVFTIYVK